MTKHFVLHTQIPKPKSWGCGVLSVDKNGEAIFFEGNGDHDSRVLASMKRVKLDFTGADGIMLSGMEPTGFDKLGKQKFIYQEWWLRYWSEA